MNTLPKRVPRLWCARLGLLPLAASRAVNATSIKCPDEVPAHGQSARDKSGTDCDERNRIAEARESLNARPGEPLRNQS
jgi:hypothetical protein